MFIITVVDKTSRYEGRTSGEIWMTDFCAGIQDKTSMIKGYRPAVIVSNEMTNTNPESGFALVVPVASNQSKGACGSHVTLNHLFGTNKLKVTSTALCEQIITVEKSQVRFCLGKVTMEELEQLDQALMVSLGIMKD